MAPPESDQQDTRETWKATFEKTSEDPLSRAVLRGTHEILMDEPHGPPVGTGNDEGPSPTDILVLSLISCQASVLAQALNKARIEEFEIGARGDIAEKKDIEGEGDAPSKWVADHITVELDLEVPAEYEQRAQRCLEVYDSACIVGQSFKHGIDYSTETQLTLDRD